MNNIPIDSPFLKILPQHLGFGEGVGLGSFDAEPSALGQENEERMVFHNQLILTRTFFKLARGKRWAQFGMARQKGLDIYIARNWDEMINHVREHRPNVNQMSASVWTFKDQFGSGVLADQPESVVGTPFLSNCLPGVTPIPHWGFYFSGMPEGFHGWADEERTYDVVIFTQVSEGVSTFRSRGEPTYRLQPQGKQGTWVTDFEMELAAPETGVMYFLDTCKDPKARSLNGVWRYFTRGKNPRVRIISPEPPGKSRTRKK